MGRRLKALLADTLFKRLFALMWLALVISHAVAFLVVTSSNPGGGGRWPTFPSLPPVSFAHRAPASAPASATRDAAIGDRSSNATPTPPPDRPGNGGPPEWRGGPGGPGGPPDMGRPGHGGGPSMPPDGPMADEIGRASCRERV